MLAKYHLLGQSTSALDLAKLVPIAPEKKHLTKLMRCHSGASGNNGEGGWRVYNQKRLTEFMHISY